MSAMLRTAGCRIAVAVERIGKGEAEAFHLPLGEWERIWPPQIGH